MVGAAARSARAMLAVKGVPVKPSMSMRAWTGEAPMSGSKAQPEMVERLATSIQPVGGWLEDEMAGMLAEATPWNWPSALSWTKRATVCASLESAEGVRSKPWLGEPMEGAAARSPREMLAVKM